MNIKDLAPGKYTVTSYELKNGLYRNSYIVDFIDENNPYRYGLPHILPTTYQQPSPGRSLRLSLNRTRLR